MDNDAIHKFAYRLREFFADLLRFAVPELDLDAAEEVSATHVGPRADGVEQPHGDVTWRVPFKAGSPKDGTRPSQRSPEHGPAHAERRRHAAGTAHRRRHGGHGGCAVRPPAPHPPGPRYTLGPRPWWRAWWATTGRRRCGRTP